MHQKLQAYWCTKKLPEKAAAHISSNYNCILQYEVILWLNILSIPWKWPLSLVPTQKSKEIELSDSWTVKELILNEYNIILKAFMKDYF